MVLILQDSITFPVLFLGAIKIGAVPVPVNTLLTAEDYDDLLRDSRAVALVVSAALFDKVSPILAGQPFLEHALVDGAVANPGATLAPRAPPGARLPVPAPAAPTTADDVAFWLYTSGSTGKLKGAVHLHGDMVQTAELYAVGVLGLREDDVVFPRQPSSSSLTASATRSPSPCASAPPRC